MRNNHSEIDECPPTVSVVGFKDSGKTSIAVGTIRSLRNRGWKVMSVKHGHHHEIDTPGTDSWRLRHEGGAEKVVLTGPEGFAVMGDWCVRGEMTLREVVSRYLAEADLVIAEGYKDSDVPKIEVWRSQKGSDLLYRPENQGGSHIAVVSDRDDLNIPIPVFNISQPDLFDCLAQLIEGKFLKSGSASK